MPDLSPTDDDVVLVQRLGTAVPVRRKDLAPGEVPIDTSAVAAEQAGARQREALDTWDEKIGTFVEGAVDAASFGLIRDRSDVAEVRREVNSGSYLAGEFFGNAAGMKIPFHPAKYLAEGAIDGAKAVESALGVGGVLGRGIEEGAVGLALGAAGGVGHQAFDALIEDKDFAAEAVAKDAGLGAMLGFGLGILGGGLGKLRGARPGVKAQGGLSDPSSEDFKSAAEHTVEGVKSMDDALATHEARYEGLKAIDDKKVYNLDPDLMEARGKALAEAKAARASFPDDIAAAMGKTDPAVSKAIDDYTEAFGKLDNLMDPRFTERARMQRPGNVEDVPGYGKEPLSIEDQLGPEEVPIANLALNAGMRSPIEGKWIDTRQGPVWRPAVENPGAAYEAVWGKPFEPLSEGPEIKPEFGATKAVENNGHVGVGAGAAPDALTGGVRAPKPPPVGNPVESVNTGVARAAELGPRDLGNGVAALPDGYMMPAADAAQNADAFARFSDRMAEDTLAVRARKAASFEAARAENALRPAEAPVPEGPGGTLTMNPADKLPPAPEAPAEAADPLADLKRMSRENPPGHEYPPERADAQFMERWWHESQKMGPRVSPGDVAAARIQALTDRLYASVGERGDAVAALELAPKYGMHEARTAFATRVQQVQLLSKAAAEVSAIAKGATVKTSPAGRWLRRRVMGKAGAAVGFGVAGPWGAIVGYNLGAELAGRFAKSALQTAGAAGRAVQRVAGAADKLLSGGRSPALAAAVVNKPYAYSHEGPIADPVERVMEIQRVAANPDAARRIAMEQCGDLAVVHPELAGKIADSAVNRIVKLAAAAPAIYFDRLGLPLPLSAQALRHFLEYEGAVHEVDRTLNRIGSGTATEREVVAFRETSPVMYQYLVKGLLGDPAALNKAGHEALRRAEAMTGVPLTGSSDPNFRAAQMAAWEAVRNPQGKGNPSPMKPTAAGMATPAQGAPTGRAPGN